MLQSSNYRRGEDVVRKDFPLLQLPPEIRNEIYELCLLEPPRWERRHDISCEMFAETSFNAYRPPFKRTAQNQKTESAFPENENMESQKCICFCRRGISLLQVNKQIHSEAATIFWAGNEFCDYTTTPTDFQYGMYDIRPEYQELISGLRIPIMGGESHLWEELSTPPFWNLLLSLKSLKTLDIPVIQPWAPWYIHIASKLPELKRLGLLMFENLPQQHMYTDETSHYWVVVHLDVLVTQYVSSKDLDLNKMNSFSSMHYSSLICKAVQKLLEINKLRATTSKASFQEWQSKYNDRDYRRSTTELANQAVVQLEIFGLPLAVGQGCQGKCEL